MGDIFDAFSDDEATPKRRRRSTQRARKSSAKTLAIMLVLISIIAGVSVYAVPRLLDSMKESNPISDIFKEEEVADFPSGSPGENVEVVIPAGANGTDMAAALAEAGVVASAQAFVNAFNADAGAGQIQPGTYSLPTQIPASEAIALLKDHQNQRVDLAITIPEGFTKTQVHERISNVMEVPIDEVTKAAENVEAIGLPEVAGGNVEGWYKPGTENFAPGTPVTDIMKKFIENRVKELDELGVPADQRQAVLTKASILEREVNLPQYYGQVARVIENRLVDQASVNGRLQMDSTVLYGVGKSGGVPTREELDNDNLYNTYLHPGLPPSPIGAAGTEAIKAVMAPPEGDWLYFVTINLDTGETLFAATLEEHNANVAKLREWINQNPEG